MDKQILLAPACPELTAFVGNLSNLADGRLGAKVVDVSDEFFAAAERMLNPAAPIRRLGEFDNHGAWMDGWESRRKRGPGHDWAIVKLANPAIAHKVDFDTSFFTGNFAPAVSLESVWSDEEVPSDDAQWVRLLSETPLAGDRHHLLELGEHNEACTHVRVNIYPDGGVARFRLYGCFTPQDSMANEEIDLVSALNGGTALLWNDSHYGHPQLTLVPGRGIDMGDGWETRRRREPGYDWAIFQLGTAGIVSRIEIDTAHFKGNFPHQCSIEGAYLLGATTTSLASRALYWQTLLPPSNMGADEVQSFEALGSIGAITHIKLNLHPDGGVSRLRVYGRPAQV